MIEKKSVLYSCGWEISRDSPREYGELSTGANTIKRTFDLSKRNKPLQNIAIDSGRVDDHHIEIIKQPTPIPKKLCQKGACKAQAVIKRIAMAQMPVKGIQEPFYLRIQSQAIPERESPFRRCRGPWAAIVVAPDKFILDGRDSIERMQKQKFWGLFDCSLQNKP
ncbi:MAG: hypothetical protein CM15mP8_3400 [Methanobacteriota archaeon]|nr:MAG: hypothetical protein CM15mP8_3400 [Euryarchaeota archaeon]